MSNRITNIAAIVSGRDTTFSGTMRNVREELTRTASAAEQVAARTRGIDVLGGIMPTLDIGSLLSQAMGNVGRVFDEIENGLKRIEQRSDAGDVLGFTYQQMQALEVAATVADMPVDRLSQTFGRLLKSVALAGEGSKEAQKDLARLGLTVKDLEGMTAWQVIGLVADRLSEIASPADRAAAAMELFGREAGLKMTQVLGGGADAMERYMATAKSLGLFLEDEMVQAAKLAGDATDLQGLRIQASLDRQAAKLADVRAEWERMKADALDPALGILSAMNRASDELGASLAAMFRTGDRGSTATQDADLTRKYLEESLAGLQSGRRPSGQWPTTMNDSPAVVEAEDQAKKLEGIYDQIEEEQKKSAERIAAWRQQVRQQELEQEYQDVGKQIEREEKERKEAERKMADEAEKMAREVSRVRDAAARDAAQAWDSSGGGMGAAPLAVMGTAEQQLASYQASRARGNAEMRAEFIERAVEAALRKITVKTEVVQGGVTAAPV